jgi:drug/metabolite transporter (DMT)-like permease
MTVVATAASRLSDRRGLGVGAVGATVALWASAFVGIRYADRELSPGALALGRLLVGSLVLGLLVIIAGCLVSFAGAVLIGVATSRHGIHEILGAVLCLLAAFSYAGGVVAQKPVLRSSTPLMVTWLACTIGAISCLPYAGTLVQDLGHASGSTIAWTIYLGVAPTAIGFVTWAYALARTTAGKMGSTTYLVPPLALLFGWAFLGEVPPFLVLPGGVLCLAGVAIARTGSRRPAASGPRAPETTSPAR